MVDNFDSFSFNLVHYLEKLDVFVSVETNVSVDPDDLIHFDAVVLSPGPGLPATSGKLMAVVAKLVELKKPTLGVCLGMQALAEHFGDDLYNQEVVKHGLSEEIRCIPDSTLFTGLPETFNVGLYHSWAVELKEVSKFKPTAWSASNVLMAMEHESLPFYGVQFHPESVLSEFGLEVLSNFLKSVNE